MHGVAQRYAHYFNKRGGRTGPLWEGRFRSCIVESSRYVLACYRYIELNPVRARMVGTPDAYRWSSASGNAGLQQDALLTPHSEYLALALPAYRRLLLESMDGRLLEQVREATNKRWGLGSARFREGIAALLARRAQPLPR